MICQSCQHENPPDGTFCGACGARLVHECPRCSQQNPPGNAFCGKCGQRLAPEEPAEETEEPEKGERRQLTVLFCDLVGSTELTLRLDPEEYREALRAYHSAADAVIARYGGYVAQHLGDGLLVYFGWPQTYDDSAERAVHAGLGLIAATATIQAGGTSLTARVGLHTGAVVVSDVGAGRHRETLAVGDTPNVAARVQSAAAPGEVFMTAATHRLVAGLFVVEDRGSHPLKGVPQPIELYAVAHASGVRGRLAAAASRGFTPFVNRVEERALLRSRFERVCDGDGQVVVLIGEAGIGKSRLAQVLREELADTPHTWLETAASPHFVNTPFHPVSELLRQRRPWDDDDPESRAAGLARTLRRAGLDPEDALPLVAPLLDVPVPATYRPLTAAPEVVRKRLQATLTSWLFATARLQPLVILIEDLHWADPSTLELLQLLVEQVATVPVLLLGTARPEFQVPWPSRAHSTQLMLSRLTQRHVREMVIGVAAQAKLLAEVVEQVAARTDGVPLFVEELTKAVTEVGAAAAAREIPTTLSDSLMARLDRLGGPAKEVAQVASVCGREFSFEMLREVHSLTDDELETALCKLVDAELMHARGMAPDATYTFKHALVQDAAYESLLKSRRRVLHGQVAETLTRRFTHLAEAHPELVAQHHEAAASYDQAVELWQLAGEQALKRGAHREAERHLERALGLLPKLPEQAQRDWREFPLQLSLGQARILGQGFGSPRADEAMTRALALGERLADPIQLGFMLMSRFIIDLAGSGPVVAGRLAERLLEIAERTTVREIRAGAHYGTGLVDFHCGRPKAAVDRFERALAALEVGDSLPFPFDMGVGLRTYLADTWWRLGRADTACAIMAQALERVEESQAGVDRAWAFQHAALLRTCLRDADAAGHFAQRALEECAREPLPTISAVAHVVEGWSLAERGMTDAGRVLAREGLAEIAAAGQRLGVEFLACLHADTLVAAGEFDQALAVLRDAENACPSQIGDHGHTLVRRAEILVRLRAPVDDIEGAYATALDWSRRYDARSQELRAATGYARWLVGQDRVQQAGELLGPLYASFEEGLATRDLIDAREVLETIAPDPRRSEVAVPRDAAPRAALGSAARGI